MELTHVSLDKDRLLSLPKDEYSFILSLAHLTNEINSIVKMMYWVANCPSSNEPEEHGKLVNNMIFLRLLAGKLAEGWGLFKNGFFGAGLSKLYEPRLMHEASEGLSKLKRYFGSRNAAKLIRNQFAFHYSPDQVAAILPSINQKLDIYMDGKTSANTLFYFSEVLMAEALHRLLISSGIELSFDELVHEFFDISIAFAKATDGIVDAIIDSHDIEIRAGAPKTIEMRNPMRIHEVQIPWFTEVSPSDSPIGPA